MMRNATNGQHLRPPQQPKNQKQIVRFFICWGEKVRGSCETESVEKYQRRLIEKDHHGALSRECVLAAFCRLLRFFPAAAPLFLDSNETSPRAIQIGRISLWLLTYIIHI